MLINGGQCRIQERHVFAKQVQHTSSRYEMLLPFRMTRVSIDDIRLITTDTEYLLKIGCFYEHMALCRSCV